jgi:hypothetical protein
MSGLQAGAPGAAHGLLLPFATTEHTSQRILCDICFEFYKERDYVRARTCRVR